MFSNVQCQYQWWPWGLNDVPGWISIAMAQSRTANGSARTDPSLAFVSRVGGGLLKDILTESHRPFPIEIFSFKAKNSQI